MLLQLVAGREGGGALDTPEGAPGVTGVHVFLESLEGRESLAAERTLDEAVVLQVRGAGALLAERPGAGQRHWNRKQ